MATRRHAGARAAALAGCFILGAAASASALAVSKRATSNPRPAPGDPVVWEITLRNTDPGQVQNHSFDDTIPGCLEPLASCAQVVCTGGTAPGTCTLTPAGFNFSSFSLGPAGGPNDTLTCTVTTTAGQIPGTCTNTVNTFDPVTGLDIIETANVMIVAIGITKDLAVGQNPTPVSGDPVVFEIVLQNNTTTPINGATLNDTLDPCFARLASCAAVVCTGGMAPPVCTVTAGGFDLSGIGLSPRGTPGDRLNCTVTTSAGNPPGLCRNLASAFDPNTGQDVTAQAQVTIGGQLTVNKDLQIGQNPNPAPGDPVTFVITFTNDSPNTPVTNHSFVDVLDPCYNALANCSAVSCTGGTAPGTCTVNATGFAQNGFSLAPNGQAGDTLTCTVTAIAGNQAGACRNTVNTSDPATGGDVVDFASANITVGATLSVVKEVAAGQSETPPPNSFVDFVITIRNLSSNPVVNGEFTDQLNDLCFRPLADCSTVTCSGGAGGNGCGITGCVLFTSGFFYNGWSLDPMGTPGDTITFTVSIQARGGLGLCFNQGVVRDPVLMTNLVSTKYVTISNPPAGSVQVTKRLRAGQSPTVAPGDPVVFEVIVTNTTSPPAPLSGITLSDTLDAANCFESIVSCAQLQCVPPGPGCGNCTVVNPSRFDVDGIGLAAPGSAGDSRTYEVTVTAANVTSFTNCGNSAVTSNPSAPAASATVAIDPGGSTICDLNRAVESSPTRAPAPWLYTQTCPLGDMRLPGPTFIPVGAVTNIEPLGTATGFQLTLYQLDCPCAGVIRVVKNTTTAPPVVTLHR